MKMVLLLGLWMTVGLAGAAELGVVLPLGRTAYQTNERIDFVVTRTTAAAGELVLTLTDAAGTRMQFVFPTQRGVEFVHINGALLKPGRYTVEIADGTATGKTDIEIFSHIRQSSYRLINWGRATTAAERLPQGAGGFGYNLFYLAGGEDPAGDFIRAGVDRMGVCIMGGGHQMDLRLECDWSDPYVIRGGTQRAVRQAFADRTSGNVPGVHFYDEPGLTWWTNPATGEFVPHDVPAQIRSFEAAFDRSPPQSWKLDPNNPADVAAWRHWARWKLGFMDAAWKDGLFGIRYVRPDFLGLTQSQYGWTAFVDGYYFNVVRSLSVISGHGGYHDYGLNYFNPSYTLEMSRARDLTRDCWYLPTWFGATTADEYRLEHNLCFQTGIEGMISPPELDPASQPAALPAILECNQIMGRLGTVFTTMPVTRPPVAMLYSLSDLIATQTVNRTVNYAHDTEQEKCIRFVYLAGKQIQHPILPIVEEDVLDGTLAAHHRAIILPSIRHLDAAVISALEQFAVQGGLVLLAGDCTVKIKGAIDLGVNPRLPDEDSEPYRAAVAAKRWPDLEPFQTTAKYFAGAEPLARALRVELERAGIRPVFECDAPGISATRHAEGDIEYLFAVNATPDPAVPKRTAMKATTATIRIAAEGRALYDAVNGGPAAAQGRYDFAPGHMRVFARTARPIGAVHVATPVVTHDLTQPRHPITLRIAAALLDKAGGILCGSAPLRIQVVDPKGATRYDLYRATKLGLLTLELPLAANDVAGDWNVRVTELLNHTTGHASFTYRPAARCGAVAGLAHRAIMLGGEEDNLFRFARVHHAVTIVTGASDYHLPAAQRLQKILRPWGVRCTIVSATEINKPRSLTEEEAPTWVGLPYAGSGQIKPGAANPVQHVGFAIDGPVILLGTPEDNPLIAFLLAARFLPYPAKPNVFPGAGRGYVAWQRDGIGKGQESVTLIGYDAEALSEAVGSFYEAVAGLDPLTPWLLPVAHTISHP